MISSTVIFRKSVSLFKSKIEKGSLEKGFESYSVWTGWATTKIEEHRMLNPLPKPRPQAIASASQVKKFNEFELVNHEKPLASQSQAS